MSNEKGKIDCLVPNLPTYLHNQIYNTFLKNRGISRKVGIGTLVIKIGINRPS